jgi:hypothetical protein
MRRNIHKAIKYKNDVHSIFCANPDCKTPVEGIEIHHIIPLKYGGEDIDDNMIQLCHKCHTSNNYHQNWRNYICEMLIWKMIQEGKETDLKLPNENIFILPINQNTEIIKSQRCTKCDIIKSADQFSTIKLKSGKLKLKPVCKHCTYLHMKEYGKKRRIQFKKWKVQI